jgi:hypothetical protein
MLFEDEKLEEYIQQIKKELDEFTKMRNIILNHFKSKSLSETIAIINNQYYIHFINDLKQIRHYDDESDYYYTIEQILFDYFTKKENAVEIQFLDVYPEDLTKLIDGEPFDVYILEENNQLYLLTSNMGQGFKIHQFQKFEIQSPEMQLLYAFSKEYKELKQKYKKKLKGTFMLELLQSLQTKLDNRFEKISKTTNSSVYFEREKANNVKEIYRINFVDDNIKYYNVYHQTTLDNIKQLEPTDSIPFENNQEILDYIYGE